MIKLFQPYITHQARENVLRVLGGTQIAEGPEVKKFEEEFASRFNLEPWQVVTVNSGTAALELAYEISGIENGSEVITPVLTCTATNIPLARRGADIIFADVEGKESLNMDPGDVAGKISSRTKAVVLVHFGGSPWGAERVSRLAQANGVDLIVDAAQSLGEPIDPQARFTCISLQAIKSLTAGDGGIIICKNPEDAAKARRLRWFGYDRELKQKMGDIDLTEAGYKMHMNDISAAIARGNLMEWEHIVHHRRLLNAVYAYWGRGKGFIEGIWNPQVIGLSYAKMKPMAQDAGFEIGQHHYRNDKYSIFKTADASCPHMDALAGQYFLLPCHMGVNEGDAVRLAKLLWKT